MASFVSDFKTIIESDASINASVTGAIKFGHLPEDFDISKVWVVWDYKVSEQANTLSQNNCFTNYTISITVTATDTVVLNNLCDLIVNYLNRINTRNFPDIYLITDSKITTLTKPKNIYQNALEFNAIHLT